MSVLTIFVLVIILGFLVVLSRSILKDVGISRERDWRESLPAKLPPDLATDQPWRAPTHIPFIERLRDGIVVLEQDVRASYIEWVLLPEKLQDISRQPAFFAFLEGMAWKMVPRPQVISFEIRREEHATRCAELDRIWRGEVRAEIRQLEVEIRKQELDEQTAAVRKHLIDLKRDVEDLEAWEKEIWVHPESGGQTPETSPAEAPKKQIREILDRLQQLLVVRRGTVERREYKRLGEIDTNCAHLLDILKQYGIEATTYAQASQIFEERFAVKLPAPVKKVVSPADKFRRKKALEKERDELLALARTPEEKEELLWKYDELIRNVDEEE